MNGVDLRRFEFDYDTTWNAFFLDAGLNVYSRYGGRDEGEPEARMSKESLLVTMHEVLAAHAARDAPQAAGRPLVQPVPAEPFTPDDIPLLRKNHQGCLHCHQIREYQQLQAVQDGSFEPRQLFRWPLPEEVGFEFDRAHGHRIERVTPQSAAAAAGLKPGDLVVQIDDVPVRSEYDVRWALGRAPDGQPLHIAVERRQGDAATDERVEVEVTPTGDWRRSELGWRKSLRSVPVEWGMRAYPISRSQREEGGYALDQLAIKVVSVRDKGLAKNLGLHKGDFIVAVGKPGSPEHVSANRTFEEFRSDLLNRFRPGELVRLTVRRDGREVELSGPFPEWHSEETSVP